VRVGRRHESLAVVVDERNEVLLLLVVERPGAGCVDGEDRVVPIEVPALTRTCVAFRDPLRVSADVDVEQVRLAPELPDRRGASVVDP
jgi:hypothetical protein